MDEDRSAAAEPVQRSDPSSRQSSRSAAFEAIATSAGIGALAGGGLIINADGIDFRVLEPLWLAVTLFLVIPGAWGITVVSLTERLLHTRAIFPALPDGIDDQHGGAIGNLIGWLVLAAVTTLGLIDLTQNLNHLA